MIHVLSRFSGSGVAVSKCHMPDENTVYYVYMGFMAAVVLYFVKIKGKTN